MTSISRSRSLYCAFVTVLAIALSVLVFRGTLEKQRSSVRRLAIATTTSTLDKQRSSVRKPTIATTNSDPYSKNETTIGEPYSNTKTRCISLEDSNFTKPFLYMTQTEECGPPYLLSNEALGDPSACRCDFLILSYKKKCENNRLPHVRYLNGLHSTWATGRNMLYESAMQRKEKYMYYVIMDDDSRLGFKKGFAAGNPWREYEASLLRGQLPAVGLDDHFLRVDALIKASGVKSCEADFLPAFIWDAMVSAFHYKAIAHLLPYHTEHDKVSWIYVHRYVFDKAALLYYGYAALHRKVYAINTKHRPYPRIMADNKRMAKTLAEVKDEIRAEFPESPQLLDRDLTPSQNAALARRYCIERPQPCPTFPAANWF